ncbi:hypothetical protein A3780_20605 [Kosakonia radicincitans]|uniref:hypothetical protein n=1 Tax=Kosakonia radicincitans TaxID=283686 RepID=UPI000903EEA5|nr:hypothetical protein [Kosakonia radicincitans]APG19843.1 hypothetical protein A3780_20605 [Kosakonia radicincitans]
MKTLTMAPPAVVPDKALLATVIFTVPPHGEATVGLSDSVALARLQKEILNRLGTPVLLSVYPHRVGRRSCLAIHLTDAREKSLDILITVTGNTLWPDDRDYRDGVRWHICVPDATDMMWVLKEIDRATGEGVSV